MRVTVSKNSFNGGEWSPSVESRYDNDRYSAAVEKMKNMYPRPHGPAVRRRGLEYINEVKDSSKRVRLVGFEFNVFQSYVLELGDKYIRFYTDEGLIIKDNQPYEIVTPYKDEDLFELDVSNQSADILYIFHAKYKPRKLCRYGNTDWKLEVISYGASIEAPASFKRESGTAEGCSYVVTAVNVNEEESVKSKSVTGGDGDKFSWDEVENAWYYNIYEDDTDSGVYSWIGKADNTHFTVPENGIEPDTSKTPPAARDPFNGENNYPACATIFQQRLFSAATLNHPQKLWGSCTGSFYNMNVSSPVQDDDSIDFTLDARKINMVRWLIPLKDMLIGTVGSQWILSGKDSAITPSDVQITYQNEWGACFVPPLKVGNSVLFLEGSRNVIRDLMYQLEIEGYGGRDLTLFASHLFSGHEIVDWCYQQYPNSIVWGIRSDGALLGLTYYREHKVWGWHIHITDGKFKACECIRTPANRDEVYFAVQRTVDGTSRKYIEKFNSAGNPFSVEDMFYVDCGLTYRGSPVSEVSGLHHLEGKKVAVLYDGMETEATVANGKITIPHKASVITVGLPYTSYIKTLPLVIPPSDGKAVENRKRYIKNVVVDMFSSRGLEVSNGNGTFVTLNFNPYPSSGNAAPLFSGEKFVEFGALADEKHTQLEFKCTKPVSLTINALYAVMEVSDEF
ncbi:MAG: hypothetical protein K9M56_04260 [Victivallales bacterium]|nr:hypothetical protein [Victivallales bacterium]